MGDNSRSVLTNITVMVATAPVVAGAGMNNNQGRTITTAKYKLVTPGLVIDWSMVTPVEGNMRGHLPSSTTSHNTRDIKYQNIWEITIHLRELIKILKLILIS